MKNCGASTGSFRSQTRCSNRRLPGALAHGCRKLDLFFMVGIPHQTYGQAMEAVDYYRHLLDRFGKGGKVHAYVSPLSPFLDPGSRAFEDPSFGYKVRYRTLEEHRQALTQLSWKDMLSFETEAMSRDEIARASYQVAGELNELKYKHGLIDAATYAAVSHSLAAAEAVLTEIDRTATLPPDKRAAALAVMRKQIQTANGAALCGVDELKWPLSQRFHVGGTSGPGIGRRIAAGIPSHRRPPGRALRRGAVHGRTSRTEYLVPSTGTEY